MDEKFEDSGWKLVKLFEFVPDVVRTSVQSVAMLDGLVYVFFHDSYIQTYKNGVLQEEFRPVSGRLYHANDTSLLDGLFWICDTETPEVGPRIKCWNPKSRKVVGDWNPNLQGWRSASCVPDGKGGCYVCQVEAIDTNLRTRIMVSSYNIKTARVATLGFIPQHHRYVQGSELDGDSLWISSNDGRPSATTRFVRVALEDMTIRDDLLFHDFGEAEGFFPIGKDRYMLGRNSGEGTGEVWVLEREG